MEKEGYKCIFFAVGIGSARLWWLIFLRLAFGTVALFGARLCLKDQPQRAEILDAL